MRNSLLAAAMAERLQKSQFGVLAIAPAKFGSVLHEQVAAFQREILQPAFSDRIAFMTYETYIDPLFNSGDEASVNLGGFLNERIVSIVGR